jgi:hypothetical protein
VVTGPGDEDEEVRPGWKPPRAPSGPPGASRPPAAPPSLAARAAPAASPGGRVDPLATASLVAALSALVLLTLSLGVLFVVTLPCSALAWLLGTRAQGRIAADRRRGGGGLAHAGVVLGYVGLGLGTLAMIVWTVLILSGFSTDDLRHKLEPRRDRPSTPAQRTEWPGSLASPAPFATGVVVRWDHHRGANGQRPPRAWAPPVQRTPEGAA